MSNQKEKADGRSLVCFQRPAICFLLPVYPSVTFVWERLRNQKYFCISKPILASLSVGIKININVVAADTAAAVFGSINDPVDHELSSVWDHTGINGDGMSGSCQRTAAGVPSPSCGAVGTWTVPGCFEDAKRSQSCISR